MKFNTIHGKKKKKKIFYFNNNKNNKNCIFNFLKRTKKKKGKILFIEIY